MKIKFNIYNVLILLLVAVFLFSGFMLVKTIIIGKKEQADFEQIATLVKPADPTPEKTGPERDISAVLAQNPDTIGWIYIKDTVIDYPVMHTPLEPQKYLRLSFGGQKSSAGTPFMDYRCNLDSNHILIYAHNMKNGTMFNQLRWYRSLEYLRNNPIIEFHTQNKTTKYSVFAVATLKGDDPWYLNTNLETPQEYQKQIEYIKSKALFETGVTPQYPAKILTLSTCVNGNDDSERYIVVAAEVN
ncbi:MAG: class B sortase [Clostridia bacterium]|nr:class B sortase [Clostridia bacterium]